MTFHLLSSTHYTLAQNSLFSVLFILQRVRVTVQPAAFIELLNDPCSRGPLVQLKAY